MRLLLVVAIFGTLLLLPGVNYAEPNAECQTGCATEKASKEANCQPPGEADQARAQCLQEIQDTYNNCLNSCPQPVTAETPTEN
jgi:hypothetical protein